MASWLEPGPAPAPSSPAVAAIMRRTRRSGTAPERALRKELHRRGFRYLVDSTPPGTNKRRRADVVFRRQRVAVFVDGCFWHSCPVHLHLPRANREWWTVKLQSIRARDNDTDQVLLAAGWLPVRIWEHEPVVAAADRVAGVLHARGARLIQSIARGGGAGLGLTSSSVGMTVSEQIGVIGSARDRVQ